MDSIKRHATPIKFLIIAFFLVSVVYPLVSMFASLSDVDIVAFILSPQFTSALVNSLKTATMATFISVSLAFVLSWLVIRSTIRFKAILSVLLTLPMLIPSLSHGMGLVILLGKNGVVANLLSMDINIYGFWGIVIGSVMYSFPVAFLMISDVLKYEDSAPYEAADILGFSLVDKFKAITLPYLRKPMIAVIFASFTMIVTDYGVPLIIGGKYTTLPVLMYQEVVGLLNFNKGGVIGMFLLIPAIVAFMIDVLNKDKGGLAFIPKPFELKKSKVKDSIAYGFIGIILFLILLPIGVFVILTFVSNYPVNLSFTFDNILKTFEMNGSRYLINSLIISSVVAVIGTIISYITGYLTMRMPSSASRVLHLVSISSLAIPGIVLGLSYVIAFNQSFIYGTIGMLVLVNLVHFFASPYLLIYNALGKLNKNLEAVGTTLGISRLRMIKDVFIPQTRNTILEMMSYFFVNSMITISAVAFLSSINNKPLSLLINQFEGNMMLEASAFVSLLILIINIMIKILVYTLNRNNQLKGEF